jgi:hypothetical protein
VSLFLKLSLPSNLRLPACTRIIRFIPYNTIPSDSMKTINY